MMTDKILLKPGEVGAALAISRSKTYTLIAAGVIPAIRIGGSIRVPVDALRAWVAQQIAERQA